MFFFIVLNMFRSKSNSDMNESVLNSLTWIAALMYILISVGGF